MRNYLLVILALLTLTTAKAADPVSTKSDIKSVTVYRRGAQITREGKVALTAGRNEIVFSGLETNIDKNTIQASAPVEVIIMSVSHEVNYLREKNENPRIVRLADSLEMQSDKLAVEKMKRTALDKELDMILANQNLKGNEKGLTAEDLEKAADFFRRRLNDIYEKQLANAHKQKDIQEEIGKINQQLQELNYRKNRPSNDVVVVLEVQRAKTIDLALRYFVQDAGWTPAYDLRAENTSGPITLNYRAEVFQNTGIDWSQVMLTLSTGNPNQGGTKPNLGIWNLAVYIPQNYGYSGGASRTTAAPAADYKKERMAEESDEMEASYDKADDSDYGFGESAGLAYYTEVTEGSTTAEFKINLAQDVESGQKPQQVTIQRSELPASYAHFAIPKLDKDAFLIAHVTNWEELNLLPGNVNIFFEGTYLGQSYLNTSSTQDTLDFSLGRDKKVVIDRTQLKDYNRTKTIGSSRERTFGYEITIRNTKKEVVTLDLEENIPLSQDKEITIKVEENSGAVVNEETGKMTWKMTLQPQETKKIKLVYVVKYPKNKQVTGW